MQHSRHIPPPKNYFEDICLMRQFLDDFPPYLNRQYQLEWDEYDPNFASAGPYRCTFIGSGLEKPGIESLRIAAERMRKFPFAMTCALFDDSVKDPVSGLVSKYESYWLIIEIDYGRDVWYPCPWLK